MRRKWAACAFACGMGGAALASAADGDFSAGVGANYSTGKYGTSTETKIWSIPFTARYETDVWTLKLSVPYLRVTGPANVIPGVGNITDSGGRRRRSTTAPTTTESGLGDVVASAAYNAYYDRSMKRGLDLTGKIKFGTADADKGLGTGSNDESLQADVYQTIDRLTLFADLGYTFFGHSDFVQLDNAVYFGLGLSQKVDADNSVGASYDARQRVTPGGAPQSELTAFWNRRLDASNRLQAYLLKGFANGSPDWGFGASLLHTF
jgi:Putative MetA-pathway of phenol degradation